MCTVEEPSTRDASDTRVRGRDDASRRLHTIWYQKDESHNAQGCTCSWEICEQDDLKITVLPLLHSSLLLHLPHLPLPLLIDHLQGFTCTRKHWIPWQHRRYNQQSILFVCVLSCFFSFLFYFSWFCLEKILESNKIFGMFAIHLKHRGEDKVELEDLVQTAMQAMHRFAWRVHINRYSHSSSLLSAPTHPSHFLSSLPITHVLFFLLFPFLQGEDMTHWCKFTYNSKQKLNLFFLFFLFIKILSSYEYQDKIVSINKYLLHLRILVHRSIQFDDVTFRETRHVYVTKCH